MKYFHCPKEYRWKQYGCGFGPVNGTQAFLDLGNTCPRCKQTLKPYTVRRVNQEYENTQHIEAVNTVRQLFGESAAKNYAETKGIKYE